MFGPGGSVFVSDVHCTGTEETIHHCPRTGIGGHTCDRSNSAGVICLRNFGQ